MSTEDLRNSLQQISNDEQWYEWLEEFGKQIQGNQDIPDTLKKDLLKVIIDKILVEWDKDEKLHILTIHFKIPIILGDGKKGREPTRLLIKHGLQGRKSKNQIEPFRDYSTVTGRLSIGGINHHHPTVKNPEQLKGYSLRLSVVFRLSNLWTSTYTPYQQEIFDIITNFHEEQGWNFKQISDWFNENNYLTPRGKLFKENHVWSIYIKKNKSINRFSRQFEPHITNMKVDVVDYVPVP